MHTATIRNFILSFLALVLVAGCFSYGVVIIKRKEQELKTQHQTLSEENLRENSFYKLQKTAEESETDRNVLDTYFIKQESDSINVLNWIEATAPKANVRLDTESTSLNKISEKETKTNWIEIKLIFSGERNNVERFVGILERLPYLSYITSLSMGARAIGDWEASVTLRIYLSSYDK